MGTDTVKVLFIGGTGRTGSTLLELYLSKHKSIFGAGELSHLWGKGYRTNQLCACKKPFHFCDFWSEVIDNLKDRYTNDQLEHFESLLWTVEKITNIPFMLAPAMSSQQFRKNLKLHKQATLNLLRAISDVSDTPIIIDSTKLPRRGFLLSRIEEVELYVLHLMRDPRGVSYSWQKKKKRPGVFWKDEYLAQKSVLNSTANWNYKNLFTQLLGRFSDHYHRIRYEDFVSQPQKYLGNVFQWLKLSSPDDYRRSVDSHSISGNPMRFEEEQINLKLDQAWKKEFSVTKKWTVALLTSPLMEYYGYSLLD